MHKKKKITVINKPVKGLEKDKQFQLTWKDLISPDDQKNIKPDTIDQMQPVDWDSEQAPK